MTEGMLYSNKIAQHFVNCGCFNLIVGGLKVIKVNSFGNYFVFEANLVEF